MGYVRRFSKKKMQAHIRLDGVDPSFDVEIVDGQYELVEPPDLGGTMLVDTEEGIEHHPCLTAEEFAAAQAVWAAYRTRLRSPADYSWAAPMLRSVLSSKAQRSAPGPRDKRALAKAIGADQSTVVRLLGSDTKPPSRKIDADWLRAICRALTVTCDDRSVWVDEEATRILVMGQAVKATLVDFWAEGEREQRASHLPSRPPEPGSLAALLEQELAKNT